MTEKPLLSPVFEIVAVLVTAAGKFLFMDYLNWRLAFISAAIIFWVSYIIIHLKKSPARVRHWGFRTDNSYHAFKLLIPFASVSLLSFLVIGYYQETINITWHILPILILYPLWGIIQQYLLIAIVAGNLHDIFHHRGGSTKFAVVFVAALLFGLIHFPYYWLMLGTFVMALIYGYVFLSERNIFVLGIFHGWIGAIFFYTVVNRDPFIEVFGKYS